MRGTALLGVILIVLGIGGIAFDRFSYTETKPVLKAGPLQINSQEEHLRSRSRWSAASWCWSWARILAGDGRRRS